MKLKILIMVQTMPGCQHETSSGHEALRQLMATLYSIVPLSGRRFQLVVFPERHTAENEENAEQ